MMCNLQIHMDRDHRIHEAQRLEPVYTALAAEYGIEYQPPAQPERVVEWVREREPHPVYIPEHMRGTVTTNG